MADLKKYTVGWICALEIELIAAASFLDDKHGKPLMLGQNDNNHYWLGRMGHHNVAITTCYEYGTNAAAQVARDMLRTFPNVRIGMMVGIGGGMPSNAHDIRLGDVVVSSPSPDRKAVIFLDMGRKLEGGGFQSTGDLNGPPAVLRSALMNLKAQAAMEGLALSALIDRAMDQLPKRTQQRFAKPPRSSDVLYKADIQHPIRPTPGDAGNVPCSVRCGFSTENTVERGSRDGDADDEGPQVHYGTIASANHVLKDAQTRDYLAQEHDILCMEMEAAGLMNHFPCVVIRGICDYCDSHKNKQWQGYAAMTAAAYGRSLLGELSSRHVDEVETLTKAMALHSSKIDAVTTQMGTLAQSINTLLDDEHAQRALTWLHSPDFASNLEDGVGKRHPGSGRWFLQGSAFQNWQTRPNSFLFLYGRPGCGKTVLTSTVIELLRSKPGDENNVLYFFFDFKDHGKQSMDNALRSFLQQIIHGHPPRARALLELIDDSRQGQQANSAQLSYKVFEAILAQDWFRQQSWHIIIDAIDECTTRDGPIHTNVLIWLSSILRNAANVSAFVSARAEADIKSSFVKWAPTESFVELSGEGADDDIKSYIASTVMESDELSRWRKRPDCQAQIRKSLNEGARGMFRWVVCQLIAIKRCLDPVELKRALTSLPSTLAETYDRMIETIEHGRMPNAVRILQLLVYAPRPLSVEELVDAIAIQADRKPAFLEEERMPDPNELSMYCPGFINVMPQKPVRDVAGYRVEDSSASGTALVQLAHFSVKEYLMSSLCSTHVSAAMTSRVAQASLATICISYLESMTLVNVDKEDSLFTQIRLKYPFAPYSARYWPEHARACVPDPDVDLTIQRFFESGQCQPSWALWDPHLAHWDQFICSAPKQLVHHADLYYALVYRLEHLLLKFLARGDDINERSGRWGTILHAAILLPDSSSDIVTLLLGRGADPNGLASIQLDLQGYYPRQWTTPLQAASLFHENRTRQLAIAQQLLNSGANVDARDEGTAGALELSLRTDSEDLAALLLRYGADPLQKDVLGEDVFSHTLESQVSPRMIHILLQHGASADFVNSRGETALEIATRRPARAGYTKYPVIERLLQAGAEVTPRAFRHALLGHDLSTIELLLDAANRTPTELWSPSETSRSPLEFVIRTQWGRTPVDVICLVASLIDRESRSPGPSSRASDLVIQAAWDSSMALSCDLADILIDAGANVNAEGGTDHHTALEAAACKGDVGLVRLLLDRGANVRLPGLRHRNALMAAKAHRHDAHPLEGNPPDVDGWTWEADGFYPREYGDSTACAEVLVEAGLRDDDVDVEAVLVRDRLYTQEPWTEIWSRPTGPLWGIPSDNALGLPVEAAQHSLHGQGVKRRRSSSSTG